MFLSDVLNLFCVVEVIKVGFVLKFINFVLSRGFSLLIIKNKGFIGFGFPDSQVKFTTNLSNLTGTLCFNSDIDSKPVEYISPFNYSLFVVKLLKLLILVILLILLLFKLLLTSILILSSILFTFFPFLCLYLFPFLLFSHLFF